MSLFNKIGSVQTENKVPSYFLLLVGMFFFFFSCGRWVIPLATWIAPIFLLRYSRVGKPFKRLILLLILISISARFMLLDIVPSLLGPAMYALIFYYALLWFIPYMVDRFLYSNIKGFSATLIFPAINVIVEFLNTTFLGSWGSFAYSQSGNLPLLQIMSITGMWGVTFLVLWFGSVINFIWENNFEITKIKKEVVLYCSILLFVLFFGGARILFDDPESKTVRIDTYTPAKEFAPYSEVLNSKGISSSLELAIKDRKALKEMLDTMHSDMLKSTRNIARSGAKIILWPEGGTRVLMEDEENFLKSAAQLAEEEKIYFLPAYLSLPEKNPGINAENKSVMLSPDGNRVFTYLKTHPVPGSSDKQGDAIIPYNETKYGRIGTAICYDMDFTYLINKAGKQKIDIMLVPSWDWKAIDPLHTNMASFRAIENGFSLVRATGEGLSIAVDYHGKVLSRMDYFTSENQMMSAQVPITGVRTIYSFVGDTFAYLCFLLIFLLIINYVRQKRKST